MGQGPAEMRRCVEGSVPGRGLNLANCLMSGLAAFSLKYPSPLSSERDARGLDAESGGTAAGTFGRRSGWDDAIGRSASEPGRAGPSP